MHLRFVRRRREEKEADSALLYCYMMDDHVHQSPILRVKQGEQLTMTVKNDLKASYNMTLPPPGDCGSDVLTSESTNVHFHGIHVAPDCHQDNVIRTLINPGEFFNFSFVIPMDQPPGLYWYHPHVFPNSQEQIEGGASGVFFVEGMENILPEVSGLPEQAIVFRSELIHPRVIQEHPNDPKKPQEDISINYVPVRWPEYKPATLRMKPLEKQFWRIVNSCSATFVVLRLHYDFDLQQMIGVGRDNIPFGTNQYAEVHYGLTEWQIPAGSRIEIIVTAPPLGVKHARLVMHAMNNGLGGLSDPERTVLRIFPDVNAPPAPYTMPMSSGKQTAVQRVPSDLALMTPITTRELDFWESPIDPNDPSKGSIYGLTPRGQPRIAFQDQHWASINATQGTVEDWIIYNHSPSTHVFHIHQMHFLVLEANGLVLGTKDSQFWDAIDVQCCGWNFLKLRIDFTGML